jgi:hypothetical protein
VPLIATLFHGAFALVLILVAVHLSLLAARCSPLEEQAARAARRLFAFFAVTSLFVAVAYASVALDAVHLFWSVQIPIVVAFLGSGPLLADAWRDDERGARSAWWFPASIAALAAAPIAVLEIAGGFSIGRDVGEPSRRLLDLATWGLGGALPDYLAPSHELERQRGVGHLPREVTVPMGALLVAAWAWIAYCALAISARAIRGRRGRRAWLYVAPVVLGAVAVFLPGTRGAWGFDPRFFGPDSARDSGIWRSDPEVMRGFGPVLVAALAAAVLYALALPRGRRAAAARDAGASATGLEPRGGPDQPARPRVSTDATR